MPTTLVGPIRIPQVNTNYYVGEPMQRNIQQAVSFAIADSNAGNVIISQAYTGTDLIDAVTGGSPTVFIVDERNGQRQVYYWNGANYVAAAFVQDGTITAPAASFDTIMAQGADFDTCLVANSPVRTFANTGDPDTGMEWPPAGIGVSTGTAWAANSIDPTTIAYLSTPNWFTAPQTVNDDLTVWGLLLASRDSAAGMNTGTQQGCFFTWNISNAAGETDFVNNNTGSPGGFRWYNAPPSTTIDSTTEPLMTLDNNGGFLVHGTYSYLQAGDGLGPTGNEGVAGQSVARLVASVAGQTTISWPGQFQFNTYSATTWTNSAGDTMEITHLSGGPDGYSPTLWSITRAGNMFVAASITAAFSQLRIGPRSAGGWSTGSPNINADGASIIMNGLPGGSVFFNWDQGSFVNFGNGAGSSVGTVDTSGNADFSGTLTAGVKSFRIPHPLDDTKYLTHSCIEGPEIAVYYRGETVTANGQAEVTLPDYFEALTRPTDRSVLLTQILEDDSEAIIGSNTFSMLMASRVKDGKFQIRSSEPIAKVWWEVKAVRRDVDPLVKETRRDAYARPRPKPIPEQAPSPLPGAVGSGTPQAGKPDPKTVRSGVAVAAPSTRTRKPN